MDARTTITLKPELFWFFLALALLPILAIASAYMINRFHYSVTACAPLLEGCVSISRAVRSAPGLPWFRLFILPCCALLPLAFTAVSQRYFPAAKKMRFSSYVAALFLLLYVCFLGTDGAFYQWLRRIGIILFFAGTGMAQLWLAQLWQTRKTVAAQTAIKGMRLIAIAMLLLAILHLIIKHGFPLQEPIENITEWWLALILCCGFALIAWWCQAENKNG